MDSNWISVKDRLPGKGEQVFVQGVTGVLNFDGTWNVFTGMDGTVNVTHWQPLPEPPVADQEADND